MMKIPPEVNLNTLKYETKPNVWEPVMTIEVEPSIEQDEPERLAMTWNVTDMDHEKISL